MKRLSTSVFAFPSSPLTSCKFETHLHLLPPPTTSKTHSLSVFSSTRRSWLWPVLAHSTRRVMKGRVTASRPPSSSPSPSPLLSYCNNVVSSGVAPESKRSAPLAFNVKRFLSLANKRKRLKFQPSSMLVNKRCSCPPQPWLVFPLVSAHFTNVSV